MILVLSGNLDYQESKNLKVIDKVCSLSDLKKKVIETLILDDCFVDDEGCIRINDNMIYLDEILIVKKVKNIIISNKVKYESNEAIYKLKESISYYNVNAIFLD